MMESILFKNRSEAGKQLAQKLEKYKDKDVVIYALPRGGVVTAYEIASYFHAPMDLIITRKIGHPYSPEYAIGAVAENGHHIFNQNEIFDVDSAWLNMAIEKEKLEARRRRKIYLADKKPVSCKGKIAILVDDGIATGLTMKAAILEIKHEGPKQIVVAVPVAPPETAKEIQNIIDDFVAVYIPEYFAGSIGAYYKDFLPVSDSMVIRLLE